MLFAQIQFFVQFGSFILGIVGFANLFTLTFQAALLGLFGIIVVVFVVVFVAIITYLSCIIIIDSFSLFCFFYSLNTIFNVSKMVSISDNSS
jgi:hypothetical protein